MPRARRRRSRSRSAARRSWGRTALWAVLVAFGAVIVIGSLAEISAQSSGYRASTNTGYAGLASTVVEASNATGRRLATLIERAPTLANVPYTNTSGRTARAEIQQGLDEAVSETGREATEAARLAPPDPTGGVNTGLAGVMATRSLGVTRLRTAIDQELGMSPLPIAGAPSTVTSTTVAPLSSAGEAANGMGAAGRLLQGADGAYRAVAGLARRQHVPIRLPRSVWVTPPVSEAPLGPTQLSALAPALSVSAPALVPYHDLVITAVGLAPPAVASGAPGTVGTGCGTHAQSTVAGTTPSLLAPTGTVSADPTVTNCGTVDESGVTVTQVLALADPPGTPLPPAAARGASSRFRVATIRAGTSIALAMPPAAVAGGHRYTLTVSVSVPPSQQSRADGTAGTSQEFLLQIAG